MDIVTRLKMFLEQTGISNSQFADTCAIPRPTLSQLLNGRNKKVSDEVIGKIHRAYPSLNVMWLMFGDGEMLLNGQELTLQNEQSEVSSSSSSDAHGGDAGQRAISFDEDTPSGYRAAPRSSQRMATPASVNEAIETIIRTNTVNHGGRGTTSPEARRVLSIMVYYSDGRFESFVPAPNPKPQK